MIKNATLSLDGTRRYTLLREWSRALPPLMFIMLNPSTADALVDDATIRKCIGFGQRQGFGSIYVTNLFTFRSRWPDDLKTAGFPVDETDNLVIKSMALETVGDCGKVCCAWGSKARWPDVAHRADQVLKMVHDLGVKTYALRVLSDGIPSHPLMLAYTNTLKEFP